MLVVGCCLWRDVWHPLCVVGGLLSAVCYRRDLCCVLLVVRCVLCLAIWRLLFVGSCSLVVG